MADDAGHKVMLFFLEILMNNNGPLTISQLAGRFGSSNFTADMRAAAGGNEAGLKKFLQKYPSLFKVRSNIVSLYDGKDDEDESEPVPEVSDKPQLHTNRWSLPDVSLEMDAVQFFQGKLVKKEEKWVPIKSLAGHLSQASNEIRNVVGPQLEFRKWLLRHPHIFEVQGELVGLRDGFVAVATPTLSRRSTFDSSREEQSPKVTINIPPKTPPSKRKTVVPPKTPPPIHRSKSFGDKSAMRVNGQGPSSYTSDASTEGKSSEHNITVNTPDYKALLGVKGILDKNGPMKIEALRNHVLQISDVAIMKISRTKAEFIEFLRRNENIFSISADEVIDHVRSSKSSVATPNNRVPNLTAGRSLVGRKGKIFHVAKLWGIIDLGKHEHVFFDRSIMTRPVEDLQKEYSVGEMLCFTAVLSAKGSRAKWRATRVWKEDEQEPSTDSGATTTGSVSPSISFEDEMNNFLPHGDSEAPADSSEATYADADPSGTGVVPIWNFKQDEERNKRASLSLVPETYQMSASALNDLRFVPDFVTRTTGKTGGTSGSTTGNSSQSSSRPVYVDVAVQTISTGGIIATQLYQDK